MIGLLSIVLGTLAALAQTELRRLLAYSAVANAGFLALALGCGAEGRAASIFYVVTYATTALLAFAALAGRGTEPLALRDIRLEGMGALRALALVLALLSLAGIPPTPGFWAKLAVLDASWSAIGLWPTLIAALGGVFGALYYLRPMPDLLAVVRTAGATTPPTVDGAGRGAGGRGGGVRGDRARPGLRAGPPRHRHLTAALTFTRDGVRPDLVPGGLGTDGFAARSRFVIVSNALDPIVIPSGPQLPSPSTSRREESHADLHSRSRSLLARSSLGSG